MKDTYEAGDLVVIEIHAVGNLQIGRITGHEAEVNNPSREYYTVMVSGEEQRYITHGEIVGVIPPAR